MIQSKLQKIGKYSLIFMVMMVCLKPSKDILAADLDKELKFNEAYSSSITRTINDVGYQSNVQIRESLHGSKSSIPNTWKLISLLLKQNGTSYILFFQDNKFNVHTVGIDSGGALTGVDAIYIPSHSAE